MIKTFLAVAILACTGQAALAEPLAGGSGEQLVNDFLVNVQAMQGRFEQSMIDADGAVVEESAGTLEIQRPDRFRWIYAEPYEQWLVADGRNIWSYDVDLAQVTVKPQATALANTPAMLLGGGSDALQQFRFDGTTVEDGTTWVRMRPVDDSSGFESMELGFSGGTLNRMVFLDNLAQTSVVVFHDVVINTPNDDEIFIFNVPDDADLVGTPLTAEDPER